MLPELIELNRIRLEEDLRYLDIAGFVGLKGESAISRLLRGQRQPSERTLYKIRRYLRSRRPTTRRRKAS